MEGTAIPGRLTWQLAKVVEVRTETPRVHSLVLHCPAWPGHLAGQHVDIRLTAEDGYQTERSYSIASASGDAMLMLTVERLDDGEVSPYLFDVVVPGDELELRGPIGGYFVWYEALGGPLLLLAGGSGIVPLRSMLRHHAMTQSAVPARLLYSARTIADVIYRQELIQLGSAAAVDVQFTLTRARPEEWQGYRRRIDAAMLREFAWSASEHPLAYVCGPTAFVEAAASALVGLGYDPQRIRTERFGPTGT